MMSRLMVYVLFVLTLLLAACADTATDGAAPDRASSDTVQGTPDDADGDGADRGDGAGADADVERGDGAGAVAEGGDGIEAAGEQGQPSTAAAWSLQREAPLPRTEVAAAAFGGQLWVVGGLDPAGAASADVQIYDPVLDAWSDGPALPRALHHTAMVSTGQALYVLGGYGDGWTPMLGVYVLDPASGRWEDGPSLPQARGAGAAAHDGTRIVYGGGVGFDGVADDVWVLEGSRWRPVGTLSPAREHLAAASDGEGRTWFLGGREGGLDENRTEVDVVEGDTVAGAGNLTLARGGVAGFYVPGAGACMAGGEGPEGTFRDVECISADGVVRNLPSLSEPRHGLGSAVLDGHVYVALGGPEPGLTVSGTLQTLRLP